MARILIDSDLVLRNSTLHDEVSFNNQNDLNLIIDERIKYDREYILIDRDIIVQAIADPDNINNILSEEQLQIIIKQAYEAYYISDDQYILLQSDSSVLLQNILINDLHTLLLKHLEYITKIPAMEDLENNGLIQSIKDVIATSGSDLIDKTVVENYTDIRLNTLLNESTYISFNDSELILEHQNDILKILDNTNMVNLLNRTKPYLSFITDETLDKVQIEYDNNTLNITDIFLANEIKIIIDKEIDLKNKALKTLTEEDIQIKFEAYKNDLINIQLEPLIETYFQLLRTEMLGEDISVEIASQVDLYLTNQYNNIISSTIDNALAQFKDNFISNDIHIIVEEYFNVLKNELFGQDYTDIVQDQVNSFLLNHFPIVERIDIQSWIDDEITK